MTLTIEFARFDTFTVILLTMMTKVAFNRTTACAPCAHVLSHDIHQNIETSRFNWAMVKLATKVPTLPSKVKFVAEFVPFGALMIQLPFFLGWQGAVGVDPLPIPVYCDRFLRFCAHPGKKAGIVFLFSGFAGQTRRLCRGIIE